MQCIDSNGEVIPQDEAEIFIKKRQLYANFQRLWHMKYDRDTGLPTYNNEALRTILIFRLPQQLMLLSLTLTPMRKSQVLKLS
jgi:hypothetical protein